MNFLELERFFRQFKLEINGFGELSKIADRYGSDKGFNNGKGHFYAQFYEELLKELRFTKFTLVEVGILSAHHQNNFDELGYEGMYSKEQGGTYKQYPSLKMWSDYFPFSKVIGLDKEKFLIDPNDNRIEYKHFNADNAHTISEILKDECPKVIIDDGSHIFAHQQETFFFGFQTLESGGIYIIEDLNSIQGNFRAGYPPTEKIFQGGLETLVQSPAFKAGFEHEEGVINQIKSIQFSKSFSSGKINTVAIRKK